MKAVVTGGSGQIGSHVIEALLARGDSVVSIDNHATGRPEHLAPHPELTTVDGTIADAALVDEVFATARPDAVVHAAASYKDPDDWREDVATNVLGGVNVVEAAVRSGVERFVYFQTALCYGTKPLEDPITLDHPLRPANSSYAITKTAAEHYLEISGLDYVSFRLANVIGPRNVSGPLPIFCERLAAGKPCFVTAARRDFVFVGDLVGLVLDALDGTGHGAYHFSSGSDVAIKELYDAVVAAMDLPEYPSPELRPLGPDEAPSILLDPSLTWEAFGRRELTPLHEAVARAVGYFREHGASGGYTHLRHEQAD